VGALPVVIENHAPAATGLGHEAGGDVIGAGRHVLITAPFVRRGARPYSDQAVITLL
jgi:hypothetical protein